MSAFRPASRRRHVVLSSFLFLVLGFHVGVWAVQLGSLSAALRLDPSELGAALSGAAIGGIATLFLGGRLADRLGRRAVLLVGFGVTGVAFAGLAAARTFPEVVVAVVLYGLAVSFVDLGTNAVGSDFESAYDTHALTGLQAGFSLGALLGALSSAVVLASGIDYRLVYLTLSGLFIATAIVCSRVDLPKRRSVSSPDFETEAAPSAVHRSGGVVFAAALLLVCFFGDGALEGFLAVFLREALDSGVLLSGVGIAAFHLASFLGRTISSRAGTHLSARTLITGAGLLASIGMTGALLSPTTWGSIIGMLVVGFAISPVVPAALSLAGRSSPDHAGRAVAFTTAVGYTSFLISPLVVGTIATATNLRVGLTVVVATTLGIAVLGSRWPRSDQRRRRTQSTR